MGIQPTVSRNSYVHFKADAYDWTGKVSTKCNKMVREKSTTRDAAEVTCVFCLEKLGEQVEFKLRRAALRTRRY